MNIYEIMLSMWVVILTLVVIDMLDRIKKLRECGKFKSSFYGSKLFDKEKAKDKSQYKEDKKIDVGKWIRIESDGTDGTCYWYACSACHNKVPKNEYGSDYFSSYCPACGSKMRLESEVEEFDNLDTMLKDLWNATATESEE